MKKTLKKIELQKKTISLLNKVETGKLNAGAADSTSAPTFLDGDCTRQTRIVQSCHRFCDLTSGC
jgi:hypothetical protein